MYVLPSANLRSSANRVFGSTLIDEPDPSVLDFSAYCDDSPPAFFIMVAGSGVARSEWWSAFYDDSTIIL